MTSFVQRCFINFFYGLCILYLTNGNEHSENSKELPFCGLAESSSRFIFVSTLDGKLTALNPNNDGSIVWSIHPGSESMLSSSIHKLELSNYGHLVRMIPSLSGGLYKFNGENIEVIPITADNLLESSFRYSDDLVISGGKETRTFGVSLQSGRIIYECSMKGCGNISHSTDGSEVLVIQRLGQIVRAVEPRTGTEKWNFSVAQHDLKLLSECHSTHNSDVNYKLQAIVPEGVIYAVDSVNPTRKLWMQKSQVSSFNQIPINEQVKTLHKIFIPSTVFNAVKMAECLIKKKKFLSSPIVSAWQLNRGKLIKVDLFSGYQSPSIDSFTSPSIYIGMHDKQLYIQESVTMLKKRHEIISKFKHKLIGHEKNYPRIPWKPHSASSTALGVIYPESQENENALDDPSQRQTTALSVLYASPYVDGSGFYLFTDEELEKAKNASCNIPDDVNGSQNEESALSSPSDFHSEDPDIDTPHTVEIVIVSFWYYWKEVFVISITTAFLCNLMITRAYLKWKMKGLSKTKEEKTPVASLKESDSGVDMTSDKQSKTSETPDDYSSRYLTDFEPVACLGKGGFGVVFEAKNKIDDCHYAIKRILLPNKIESRERVMREVKALAKLDHHHIVRYFNAWTECPPAGWQENYDKYWVDKNKDIFTSNDVTSTEVTSANLESSRKSSVFLFLNTDSLDPSANHVQSLKGKLGFSKNDISDSFIVFGEDSKTSELDKGKHQNKDESVVTLDTETSELSNKLKTNKLSKSERPSFLLLNQNSSPESQNHVYLYIQMQLCQRQSLRDWLTANMERDYNYLLNIFEQILQAVEHVHLHGLIHRDLKPSNIFFSLDNQIKVGDFGLVTAMTEGDTQLSPVENTPINVNERHTAQVGTQLYMSQEQLLGKPYNYKVDIYSLGLILFELLVPFSTQMERICVLQNIKNDRYPEKFKSEYKKEHELLRLMLSHCPDERPTTYGIRARLPLKQDPIEDAWHFDLPMRRRAYSKTSRTSTSSNEGSSDMR